MLQSALRLLHPIMPFVTEDDLAAPARGAWSGLAPEALIIAPYPLGDGESDAEAEGQIGVLSEVVRAIRNIRSERGVDPARFVEAYVASDGAAVGRSSRGGRSWRRWRG